MTRPSRPTIRKDFVSKDIEGLKRELTDKLSDLQRQLDAQGQILPHSVDGSRPRGLRKGDRLMGRGKRGNITAIPDGAGGVASQEVPDSVTQYQDPQTGSGAPALANFPVIGDFGWYYDTSASKAYFAYNYNGAVTFPDVSTFSGTITDAQHGARSGGTLHAAATGSVAGFMSAVDKALINTATNLDTASALAQRDGSGNCFFNIVLAENSLRTGNSGSDLKVVGTRDTGWTAFSTPGNADKSSTLLSTGVSTAVLAARVQAIQIALTAHGLIGA